MRKLLFRVGVVFGGLFLISFLSNAGIVEKLVNSTLGVVVYWAYLIALALWLFFGVGPVVSGYLRKQR